MNLQFVRVLKSCFAVCAICFATNLLAAENPRGQARDSKLDPHAGRVLAEWIDAEFATQWKADDREPPGKVDDATFLRRAYLDLVGSIPPVATARDFLNDEEEYKRDFVIERLLNDRRAPGNLARVWRRMMVPKGTVNEQLGQQMEPWLEAQFRKNAPYDELAKSLLTVTSQQVSNTSDPQEQAEKTAAIMFYQASGGNAEGAADAFTRFFLGVRLGCAKCHDHPFADWKQDQFWGMAAFFNGVQDGNVADLRLASITPPDMDTEFAAKFLWDEQKAQIPKGKFPRAHFAEWLTAKENPNFAATTVNRVWQHFCGRSLVGDVDDLDQTTPEERAVLLDQLANKFVESGYDLQQLIRAVMKSRVYQSMTLLPSGAEDDSDVLAARPLKTLSPEQVFDSLEQALMLPRGRSDNDARFNGQGSALMTRLDEAFSGSPEEFNGGITQALMMMNGTIMASATNLETSRTLRATVDAPFLSDEQKLETLFLAALTRRPSKREQETMMKYLRDAKDKKTAFSDVFWSLLNTPEFVLSR